MSATDVAPSRARTLVRAVIAVVVLVGLTFLARVYLTRLSETEQRLVGVWFSIDSMSAEHVVYFRPNREYATVFREAGDEKYKRGSTGQWRATEGTIIAEIQNGQSGFWQRLARTLQNNADVTIMRIDELARDRLVTTFEETGVVWTWTRRGDIDAIPFPDFNDD